MKKVLLAILSCLAGCSDSGVGGPGSEVHGISSSTASVKNRTFSFAFNLSLKSIFNDHSEVHPSTSEYIFFNHGLDVTLGIPGDKGREGDRGR